VRHGTVAAAGLAALAVAMGIGRFAFTPILPMMQEDAGVSVAAGGWLASANYVGYLIGALTATRVRLSAPVALRGALLATGLATLAMGVTDSFALWLALRASAGVASAWVLIRVSAWSLERLASARRPALNGTVFAGVGVGIAFAGAACLVLMHLHARAASAWLVLGGAALILTVLTWPVFTDGADRASSATFATRRARHPDAVRLVLCYGAYGFGYIIPATFLPVMARREIADPAVFGWAWPIFGVAAALSPVVAVHGTVNGGNRRVWVWSHIVMAVGVALPAVWSGMLPIVLAALAVGGTFVVITLVGMQEARRILGPADAPPLMAAMTAAFGAGQILGPLSVSAVAAAGGGFTPALLLATAVLAVSAWALTRAGSAAARAVPTRA
jgi:predicted MFS family arabinose efflux permease